MSKEFIQRISELETERAKLRAALMAARDWYHRAPIDEMEAVIAAIEENFPLAMIEEALK